MKTKGFIPRTWRFIKRTFLVLFIIQICYIILLKWVNPLFTITQLQSLLTGNELKREYINWNEMPVNARLAVIAAEDQLFADHSGFDWKSIDKAISYNKKIPNRVRGASTISQQVAKNVFLWQGRSWLRKALEMYFTFMIELLWGKKRILQVYLNVAEMGKGIFGIEAAARHHFKKPALKLSRHETAMIAACLPNPERYTVKPVSRHVAGRYPWILRQMNNLQNDPDIKRIISSPDQ
ncbi:MAG: monofunctional biosynthetic peptidoglycan transglycosylase [Chitinophagaceae bacterium]